MAMAISGIPVLTGDVAENFVEKAMIAEREKGTIDFSKQREAMKIILKNAKL